MEGGPTPLQELLIVEQMSNDFFMEMPQAKDSIWINNFDPIELIPSIRID